MVSFEITVQPSAKVAEVYRRLVELYGTPEWIPSGDSLGELIATILSQHTSDINSGRAYRQLVATFPTWEAVRDAPAAKVAEAIRTGGLAALKTSRIQQVLRELTERLHGTSLSLDMLNTLDLDAAQAYLRTLPGVGPKTAACVLLFALGRPAFPVDTHVLRVARRLGLTGPRTTADAAHIQLANGIPPPWRHTMHINMIQHGREICHAQRPVCERCNMRSICDYYQRTVDARA